MNTTELVTREISQTERNDEDMEMTLGCVAKIRKHLVRQIQQKGKVKYVNNLVVLDSMFVSFDNTPIAAIAV